MTNENFNKIPEAQSSPESPDQRMTRLISEIKDIDKLINFVTALPEIKGTSDQYVFKGKELADIIRAVKEKTLDIEDKIVPLEAVTRTWGIRDKVYELLGDTVVSSELEERRQEQEAEQPIEIESILEEPTIEVSVEEEIIQEPTKEVEIEPEPQPEIAPEPEIEQKEEVELEPQPEIVPESEVIPQPEIKIEEAPVEAKKVAETPAEVAPEEHVLDTAMQKCDTLYAEYSKMEAELVEEKKKNKGFMKIWNKVMGNKKIEELSNRAQEIFAQYEQAEAEYLKLKSELEEHKK